MLTYLLKRLLWGFLTLLVTSAIMFGAVMTSAGDPRERLVLCEECDQSAYDERVDRYRLDSPLPVQYWAWVNRMVRGDIDPAVSQGGRPIPGLVATRFGRTLALVVPAWILATVASVWLATRSIKEPDNLLTKCWVGLGTFSLIVPTFITGLLFQSGAVLVANWSDTRPFQTQGMNLDSFSGYLSTAPLPLMTLASVIVSRRFASLRSSMEEAWLSPAVSGARARGISERRLLWRHSLRMTSGTFLAISWYESFLLVGGTAVIERVFSWPGIGELIIGSVGDLDVELALYLGLIALITTMLAGIATDILHTFADPRARKT